MKPDSMGKLVLRKLADRETAGEVEKYLSKVSKNSTDKIVALMEKAIKGPVILSNKIKYEKAQTLIANLEKLGAVADFKPDTSPANPEIPTPNAKAPSEKPESNAEKTPKHPGRFPLGTPRPRSLRLTVLFILFLLVTSYAYFFTSNNPFTNAINLFLHNDPYFTSHGKSASARQLPNQPAPEYIRTSETPYFLKKSMDHTAEFDLSHSVYFDKRIVSGFAEAVKEYFRIFATKPGLVTSIEVSSKQNDMNNFTITYDISLGGTQKSYATVFSTEPSKISANIDELSKILKRVSADFGGFIAPSSSINTVNSGSYTEISEMIRSFNYRDMFEALAKIEADTSISRCDPLMFLQAAETFSWLAFFKNSNADTKSADTLSTLAVANYLIASLFGTNGGDETAFVKGLMLLGLDYPFEAQENLSRVQGKKGKDPELLLAYIKRDTATLKALSTSAIPHIRLALYLLARNYMHTREDNAAKELFARILDEYPDFLPGKEFAIKEMGVGAQNHMKEYLFDVFENNLYLIREFANVSLIESDESIASEAKNEVKRDYVPTKWLTIMSHAIGKIRSPRGTGQLLTAEFIRAFVEEELLNAFYILFTIENNTFGLLEGASAMLMPVEKAFPDSDTYRAMKIELLMKYNNAPSVIAYLKTIDVTKADAFLLEKLMYAHQWANHNFDKRAWATRLLAHYREKVAPNARGTLGLNFYNALYLVRTAALDNLKRAESIDPYHYWIYKKISLMDDSGNFIERAGKFIEASNGFLTVVADWYRDHEKPDKAIEYYRKAITLYPRQEEAYRLLGEMYQKQKDYANAISVYEEFLKQDKETMAAVAIKNELGKILIENNELEKAYKILAENSESYQNGALVNFARVSEKMAKPLQAEEYFIKAAERYQSTASPSHLALFYVRQGNIETAVNILKEYLRFNHYSYYFKDFIKHYSASGDPKTALEIFGQVRGDPEPWGFWQLAKEYLEQGYPEIAKEVMWPLVAAPSRSQHIFAAEYLEISTKADKSPTEAFRQAIDKVSDAPGKLEGFGIQIMGKGHYALAYEVFKKLENDFEYRPDVTLLLMALCWRASNGSPEEKGLIAEKTASYGITGMHRLLISYLLKDGEKADVLNKVGDPDEACEAHYYIGLVEHVEGRKENALKHLGIAMDTMAAGNIEYKLAYELLEKVTG